MGADVWALGKSRIAPLHGEWPLNKVETISRISLGRVTYTGASAEGNIFGWRAEGQGIPRRRLKNVLSIPASRRIAKGNKFFGLSLFFGYSIFPDPRQVVALKSNKGELCLPLTRLQRLN